MNNLKFLRIKRGMTRKELSEKSGINIRTIEGYEQRKRDIKRAKAETIIKLCKVLNCEIQDII